MEHWKSLRDDIAHIFNRNLELQGHTKATIFKEEEFRRVAAAFRESQPKADDACILSTVLTHFSETLKAM